MTDLNIPEIPEYLFEKLDQFRGSKSREEYVLFLIQRGVLGDKPAIFA